MQLLLHMRHMQHDHSTHAVQDRLSKMTVIKVSICFPRAHPREHIGTVINGVCTPPGSWFRLHSVANSLMAHVQEDSTIAHPCIVFNDSSVSCCPVAVACAMCDSLLNVWYVAQSTEVFF